MRGTLDFQEAIFSYISLEERVLRSHPMRKMLTAVDALLVPEMLL